MKNDKKHRLEKYFPGEERWNELAKLFETKWSECKFQNELVEKLGGDRNIAMAVFSSIGDDSLEWIYESVPALDYCSPVDCLSSKTKIKRLKTMLMRMPR